MQTSAIAHPTAASHCDDWTAGLSALTAAEILPDMPPVSTLRAALSNLIPQTATPYDSFLTDEDSANIFLPLTCKSIYNDRGIRIPVVAAAEPESAVAPKFSFVHDAVARCVSEHPDIPRYLRPLSTLLITAEAVRHLVRRQEGCIYDGWMAARGEQHGPSCGEPSVAAMSPFVRQQWQQQQLLDFSETAERSHASLSTTDGDYDATTATVNNTGAAAGNLNDNDDDSLSYGRVHKRRRVDEQRKVPCCGNAVGQVVVAAAMGPKEGEVVPSPTFVQCHAEMRRQDAELVAYLREFTEVVALELGDHMSGIAVEGKEANEALSYLQRELDAHLAVLLAGASEEAGTAMDPTTLTATASTVTTTTNLSSAAHADNLRLLPQWLSKAREFAEKYPCPNLDLTARLLDVLVTAIDLVEDMGFEAALPYLARHAVVLCRDDLKIHADPIHMDVTPAEGSSSSLPTSLQEISRTFTATALTNSTAIPATSSTFILTPAGAVAGAEPLRVAERPMGQQPAIRYRLAPRPLGLLARWRLFNTARHGPALRTDRISLGPMGPSCPYPGWNPVAPTPGSNPAAGQVSSADISTRVAKLIKDLLVPDEGCSFLYSIFYQQQQQQQQPGGSSDSDSDTAAAAMVEAAVRKCFSSWDDASSSGVRE
ncbi:hypothetical protein Vafri_16283 [Volvox africanus]|uniref:Uncharacterized protein n=1 Tax=Volvox africanus TaxID=51714 RepID=A0A8J4F6H9_9CHLO|nr:hypothetical protein Vafri_16283 [Volvox africanus]